MKRARIPLILITLLGLSVVVHADLDAQAWSKLKKAWNLNFRMDAPDDFLPTIRKGKFPDRVREIAGLQGMAGKKLLKQTVNEIESYLEAKAAGKLKVLEELRNADDARALKLLVTTVKLATADVLALKKVAKKVDKDYAKALKSLTLKDGMWSGTSEAIFEKNRLEACKEIVPPFITHSLKVKRAALMG
ncbi:MAG: hypothetical protein ACYS47_18640, partial [Planctomycetota bacterium]